MAGTFVLSDNLAWLPPGWVYDSILTGISKNSCTVNHKIGDKFAESRTDVNGGMLFLDHWTNPDDFRLVINAALEYKKQVVIDKDQFAVDGWYEGFLRSIDDLVDLIEQRIQDLER